MPAQNEIRGRLALITGASGGIGSAIARALYAEGVDLALTYNSNQASLNSLVVSILSEPPTSSSTSTSTSTETSSPEPTVSCHQLDCSSPDLPTLLPTLLSSIHSRHSRTPDILIPAAGHGLPRITNLTSIPLSEWDKCMTINLRAPFLLTQALVPSMRDQHWGRIVYVSSIAAHGGGINGVHYAASKAGLVGMAKSLGGRVEGGLAGDGITVNDVAPAMVMGTGMLRDEESVRGTAGDVANVPVGRLGETEEVARVVLMCVKTGFLTGQSLLITGGLK